jgi:mannonate dehydratase
MAKGKIDIAFMSGATDSQLRWLAQAGVTDVVSSLPAQDRAPVWPFEAMLRLRKKVESFGLRLTVFEGIPVPDRVKLGQQGRDEDIDNYCESLRNMGRAEIPILCYNWMIHFNWLRTSVSTPVRGGALATTYHHEEFERGPKTVHGDVPEEVLWESLAYFLEAVVPVCEEFGVKLAMHPDDPPLSPIRGIGRIMTSPDNFQRLLDLKPSPVNGITFCQGCFTEMCVDIPATVARFADRIHFAHFRNLRGTADNFTEQFHDDGQQDMYVAMKAYLDNGVVCPMRPDHAPTMEGEDNNHPGYAPQGRLLAVGYMRGLIEAIEKA